MASLYYDLVPKDHVENLKWRIRCRERALVDIRFRHAFWQACMDDVCFFMAAACIGEGTRVVTKRGPVPIENVTQFDLVWDGFDWVSQDGPVYKGHKPSIVAYEIRVTPDHKIWTKNGWKPAIEGHDRQEVRLPDGYTSKWKIQEHNESSLALPVQMRQGEDNFWRQSSRRQEHKLWLQVEQSESNTRQDWKSSVCYLEWNDPKMHKQELQALGSIWRSRNNCLRSVDEVRELLQRYGRSARQLINRQNRQQRELRAWKLSMGNLVRANFESTSKDNEKIRNSKRSNDNLRHNESYRNDSRRCFVSNQDWMDSGRTASHAKHKAHVYDLLNCGPRQCFTVLDANDRPLLVHNCYGYDPRAKHKVIPFIPYPHQEKVFRALDEAIDYTAQNEKTLDVLVDKARAQGGTFGYLWVDLRRWLRDNMFSAGYVTRNADLVDSKTDSDTVLWKVQFAINMLPAWMQPRYERNLSQHTFENKDNGSLLKGYSAGQDVAAGGRATVFTMDEAGAKDFVSGGKDYAVMESLHDVTNCVEGSMLVVTDHGLIPIRDVKLHHRVWDGRMWVSHEGCVYQGEREVIQSYGILCTPDHEIMTTKGWKNACAEGFDREEISLPDGYRDKWPHKAWQVFVDLSLRMRKYCFCFRKLSSKKSKAVLRMQAVSNSSKKCHESWNEVYSDIQHLVYDEASLLEQSRRKIRRLRRSRNNCLRSVDEVRELSGGHGRGSGKHVYRQNQQRAWVQSRELSLGHDSTAVPESSLLLSTGNIFGSDDHKRDGESLWSFVQHNHEPHQKRLVRGPLNASIPNLASVYDLLNCGPRAAFTVIDSSGRPLLVHNCLRLVSARYIDQGVFHEACEAGGSEGGWHLILDWKDHPVHSKHSYIVRDNVPVACKPEDAEAVAEYHRSKPDLRDLLEKKGFKYEGVVRSPWYDMRCLRKTARPQLIASQLDRNPKGAVGKVFTSDLLDRMKKTHSKNPVWRGTPVFDSETLELKGLIEREDGPLTLWFRPGIDNSPPLGPFTIACDIASGGTGAYASNSIASGIDDRTGEQVLEYTIKGLEPRPFARIVVGLCLWMRKAKLGWEDSGVSSGFAKEVMEVLYYGNIFYRNVTQLGSQKKSRKPGFPCRDADKADMFEQFALAMQEGKYIPRSADMLIECGEYEWEGSKIVHAPTKNKGATDKNHGDRAIAAAGAWLVYSTDNLAGKVDSDEQKDQNPEYGSFLWREMQERRNANTGSPRYGIRDVLRR